MPNIESPDYNYDADDSDSESHYVACSRAQKETEEMETILGIAASGLSTAAVMLDRKARTTADAKKKAKYQKAAKACRAAKTALDEILSDEEL